MLQWRLSMGWSHLHRGENQSLEIRSSSEKKEEALCVCACGEWVCEYVFCCGWERDREGAPLKSGACPFIDIFTWDSGDRLTVHGSTRSAWAVNSTRKVFLAEGKHPHSCRSCLRGDALHRPCQGRLKVGYIYSATNIYAKPPAQTLAGGFEYWIWMADWEGSDSGFFCIQACWMICCRPPCLSHWSLELSRLSENKKKNEACVWHFSLWGCHPSVSSQKNCNWHTSSTHRWQKYWLSVLK